MASYVARKGPKAASSFGRWVYNLSGFNKYGLHRDDCYDEEIADVAEAVKRLPSHLYDARQYRVARALHLSLNHTILPQDQWTKYEEDLKYLEPYLNEVIREREEREDWEKRH